MTVGRKVAGRALVEVGEISVVLVDELAEAELAPTLRLIETQREDPLLRVLAEAPVDDEIWTAEDEQAVIEGREALAAGQTVSHEEILRRYG